ncbi:hypothetical protein F5Y11DRAFT_313121 [Daldinia sp. FL1419]|nr:hypothetical protein F5Y11DRAFT_313121 [Daldinia sp. FL1419]
MEPLSKKPKVGQAPYDDDEDEEANLDELSMSPTQFDARQDPMYELDKKRAKAATRLKSAFERIFEKYGKDFTGVGDEIDLETGEVIVDNGHLLSLADAKDRTSRENSVSSNEEGVTREKDAQPIEYSGAESSTSTEPPAHNFPSGPNTGPIQPAMPTGFNYQPQYPRMQSYPFGTPDPFMFGPPMFGNASIDPLWQTPELPEPLYQNRFGSVGQPMGYHHQLGYGPSMPPRGYNHGFLGPPFHHQIPRKFPHVKTTGRKSLTHPKPATNDSEDDVLSGNITQDVSKSITMVKKKPSLLTSMAEKPKKIDPKDAKASSTAVIEQASDALQKRQRRRSRKVAVPTEESLPNEKTISSPLSSEKESVMPKKTARKLSQIQVLIRARRHSDVMDEKSAQDRKQVEADDQRSQAKSRRKSIDIVLPNAPEDADSETCASPTPEIEKSQEPIGPESPGHEEIPQPTMREDLEVGNRPPAEQVDTTSLDEEVHDNPTGHQDTSNNENAEIEGAHLAFSNDNSKEADYPISDDETDTIATGIPADSKTLPPSKPRLPSSHSYEEEVLRASRDLDEAVDPDDREPDCSVIEDKNAMSPEPTSNGIRDAPKEAQEVNNTGDSSHEVIPSSPAEIEPENTAAELPSPGQEVIQLPSSPTPEPDLPPDHGAVQSDPIELDPDQPLPTTEEVPTTEEAILPLARDSHVPSSPPLLSSPPSLRRITPPVEVSNLVIRPLPIQSDQIKEADPTDIPSSPPKRSSPNKRSPSKVLTPSTPQKRNKTSTAIRNPGSTHRTPSTRRKLALTSLVPDDPGQDDDELSVLSSSVTSSPFLTRLDFSISMTPHRHRNIATPRKSNRRSILPGTSTPHRSNKPILPPATDSRASRGTKRRFAASSPVAQSSPLGRTVVSADNVSINIFSGTPSRQGRNLARAGEGGGSGRAGSPGSSPVREPRKCGVDGYVCDRNFCFTCCK